MNLKYFSSVILFGLLASFAPTQLRAQEPSLEKILLYGGVAVATVGVISVAQNRPKSGLSLIAIGAGMAGAARPEKTEAFLRNLLGILQGKTKAERMLESGQRGVEGIFNKISNWLPK